MYEKGDRNGQEATKVRTVLPSRYLDFELTGSLPYRRAQALQSANIHMLGVRGPEEFDEMGFTKDDQPISVLNCYYLKRDQQALRSSLESIKENTAQLDKALQKAMERHWRLLESQRHRILTMSIGQRRAKWQTIDRTKELELETLGGQEVDWGTGDEDLSKLETEGGPRLTPAEEEWTTEDLRLLDQKIDLKHKIEDLRMEQEVLTREMKILNDGNEKLRKEREEIQAELQEVKLARQEYEDSD